MKKLLVVLSLSAVMSSGCARVLPVLATPTPYEDKVPAQFDIGKRAQGKVAVLVQGAPSPEVRIMLTEAILRELNDKTSLKKSDLVPASAISEIRKDEQRYLSMSQGQIGGAVGAGTVLAVKIVNYGLYPVPLGGYYDASIKVSATLIDVKTDVLLWPLDGGGREISLTFDAERGTADAVTAKILVFTAHGIARYLYDCPKAYWHTSGEERSGELGN
jgi:hypothetical protein